MNLMFDLPDEEDPTDQPADPTDPTDPTDQPACMDAALDAEEQIHAISEQLSKKEYEFAAKVIEGEHSVDTAGIDDPA